MKLILCPDCEDIVKAGNNKRRYCRCRKSYAYYIDDVKAVYGGKAIPLGISNPSLAKAIKADRGNVGKTGIRFEAFVIPKNSPRFVKDEK